MSLKTFLHKIADFFSNIFHSMVPELQKAIAVGVEITDAVKNFDAANPEVADILTAIIPGTLDDTIKQKLREELPKIAIELRLIGATVNVTDPNEIMLNAVKVIQQMSGDYKSAFLHDFSILAAQVAADGKLTWSDAVYLLEWFYRNKPATPVVA